MSQGAAADASSRRKPFDVAKTISQIANLQRSTAPAGFEIRVADTEQRPGPDVNTPADLERVEALLQLNTPPSLNGR